LLDRRKNDSDDGEGRQRLLSRSFSSLAAKTGKAPRGGERESARESTPHESARAAPVAAPSEARQRRRREREK